MVKAFEELAEKLNILGVPDKLRILELLAREGQKSISAVSKDLNIHFSTAHKYLEQLEKISLVRSDTVKEDRLKRYFYIKDFDIRVSSDVLAGKETESVRTDIKVITRRGNVINYSREQATKPYYDAGIPYAAIKAAVDVVEGKLYSGITTVEIGKLFEKVFLERANLLGSALKSLKLSQAQKTNFESVLEYFYPETLKMHQHGDIFISNLGGPALLNFAHDVRGLAIHGTKGKSPVILNDLFEMIIEAVKIVSEYNYGAHSIDSFNYFIAPLASKSKNLKEDIEDFLRKIDKLGREIYLGIDLSVPRFSKSITPVYSPTEYSYVNKNVDIYDNYESTANMIKNIVAEIISKYKNIKVVFKIWKKDDAAPLLNNNYVANLSNGWQTLNANYIGPYVRLDATWKEWSRTVRAGEAQNIIINFPRIALETKSVDKFLQRAKQIISVCVDAHISMAELIQGNFLRQQSKVRFYSAQNRRWTYVHIDDCLYSISVTGLNEAVEILSGVSAHENVKIAEKILLECNKSIREASIRLSLKEDDNPLVTERFYNLDRQRREDNRINFSEYTPGVRCKYDNCSILHKCLLGGHCIVASSVNVAKDFGLIRIII